MKSSILLWFCTGALACSHETRSARSVPPPSPEPTFISRLDAAPVKESRPTAPGIPSDAPALAPPVAPPSDSTPLTPASGAGSARPAAAASLVAATPAPEDQAVSAQDQQSVREIRGLLAGDPALASIAPRLVIVARSGQVWLRGQVNTAAQRAAIEKAARQAGGVVNVKNELVVLE